MCIRRHDWIARAQLAIWLVETSVEPKQTRSRWHEGEKMAFFRHTQHHKACGYTPFNDESLLKSYFYISPDSLASVHFLQNGNWWLYRWDFIGFAPRFMFSQFFSTKYFGLKWYLKVIKRSRFLVSCSKTILLSGTSSLIEWKIVKVRLSTI